MQWIYIQSVLCEICDIFAFRIILMLENIFISNAFILIRLIIFWNNVFCIHSIVFSVRLETSVVYAAVFLVAAIVVVYVAHGFCAHTHTHTCTHRGTPQNGSGIFGARKSRARAEHFPHFHKLSQPVEAPTKAVGCQWKIALAYAIVVGIVFCSPSFGS